MAAMNNKSLIWQGTKFICKILDQASFAGQLLGRESQQASEE